MHLPNGTCECRDKRHCSCNKELQISIRNAEGKTISLRKLKLIYPRQLDWIEAVTEQNAMDLLFSIPAYTIHMELV